MLIADTNQFHPLLDGHAYAAGHAADGTAYSIIILRATYSTTLVDTAYASSLAQARATGLLVGHYGYMTAGADAAAQGTFFGQTVKAHGGLQPGDTIWCDCEEGAGDQEPRVQAFLAAAHAVLGDNPADEGEYSGDAFYKTHLGTTPNGEHRWIASYGTGAPADGEILFQFTDAQAMPGVSGLCDCSIYNGTTDQYKITFGWTPPAPAPTPEPAPPAPTPTSIGENMQSILVRLSVGANGEGWAIYDGGTNSEPGAESLSPAIPFASFVAATPYSDDPATDHPDTPTPTIGVQNRGGNVFIKATGAQPGTATAVAMLTFTG